MRSPPPCRTGLLWASAEQTSIIPLRLSKCSCSSFHSRIMIMNLLLNNQQNNKQTMKTVLSTGWPLVVMSQRWWTANSTGKRDWEVQADNRTQFQISNIEIRSLPTYLAPIFSIRLICIKWADKSVCVFIRTLFIEKRFSADPGSCQTFPIWTNKKLASFRCRRQAPFSLSFTVRLISMKTWKGHCTEYNPLNRIKLIGAQSSKSTISRLGSPNFCYKFLLLTSVKNLADPSTRFISDISDGFKLLYQKVAKDSSKMHIWIILVDLKRSSKAFFSKGFFQL